MVYRQFAPLAEQFRLKFQMTLLFPSVELLATVLARGTRTSA
jgi:hypothetical protein